MAANMLWAHLLRKDATTTDAPTQIPPIAPQDKTGTSMRMLIHDTQVNLEKFSARLDGLLQRVDDCRAEVVNANKLLDVERDRVLTEILEIANRCRSEMKTHVGTPAQAATLDLVHVAHVSTEKSVQALEKRIDVLQALLQAHANTMQSIQEQQNTLIGTILPLVPILHGVSPQMDQIKAALSDMVTNAVSAVTSNIESARSTLVSEFAQSHGCARSSTGVGSSNRSTPGSRRKQSSASDLVPQEFNAASSSPLESRSREGPRASLKRARAEGATHQSDSVLLPRKMSRLVVPLTSLGDQTPRTPRQPLADLPLPPSSNAPRIQHHVASTSHEYMRPLETREVVGGGLIPISQPDERARLPMTLLVHDKSSAGGQPAMHLPSVAEPSDLDALSKEIKMEDILVADPSGVISVLSSPLSLSPSPAAHVTFDSSTNVAPRDLRRDVPRAESAQVVPLLLSDPIASDPDASAPKSMSLRDRRAQMSRFGRTETRRFIPMVPWSDEEE